MINLQKAQLVGWISSWIKFQRIFVGCHVDLEQLTNELIGMNNRAGAWKEGRHSVVGLPVVVRQRASYVVLPLREEGPGIQHLPASEVVHPDVAV
jgi:hypothetical protein